MSKSELKSIVTNELKNPTIKNKNNMPEIVEYENLCMKMCRFLYFSNPFKEVPMDKKVQDASAKINEALVSIEEKISHTKTKKIIISREMDSLYKQGNKNGAKHKLIASKQLDKMISRLENFVLQLNYKQSILSDAETNAHVVEALSSVKVAFENLNISKELDTIGDITDEIAEKKDDIEEITELLSSIDDMDNVTIDEEELDKELELLCAPKLVQSSLPSAPVTRLMDKKIDSELKQEIDRLEKGGKTNCVYK